jgi:hypothetical protein
LEGKRILAKHVNNPKSHLTKKNKSYDNLFNSQMAELNHG